MKRRLSRRSTGYMHPRPLGKQLAPTVGSSFPSGHSMLATGIYLALTYLTWNWMPTRSCGHPGPWGGWATVTSSTQREKDRPGSCS
jgi:membrane-associated phospholipid phosphatase